MTDSTADLPAAVAERLGIVVVPSRFAFAAQAYADGDLDSEALYSQITMEQQAPRIFGAPEAGFRAAFEMALGQAESVLCLVTPFDVSASFTTASAAMLSMDGVDIKILNPGVASAGLCSLLRALGPMALGGASRVQIIDALERLEPECETVFVPADVRWLERAGRLPLIEDRIGVVGDRWPVVRAGTRITGLAAEDSIDGALSRAVELVGRRAQPGQPLIATVAHANAEAPAQSIAQRLTARWPVSNCLVTALSATFGAQLGPGTIGLGMAPDPAGGLNA